MHTMCKVIANALNQALDSTYNRLAKVNNIINKLEHIAYHSNIMRMIQHVILKIIQIQEMMMWILQTYYKIVYVLY